jgi:hypothetical protein
MDSLYCMYSITCIASVQFSTVEQLLYFTWLIAFSVSSAEAEFLDVIGAKVFLLSPLRTEFEQKWFETGL